MSINFAELVFILIQMIQISVYFTRLRWFSKKIYIVAP